MRDVPADPFVARIVAALAPIARWWVVGGSGDCDTVIADEYVSDRHALVVLDCAGRYWVADLGSTTGTYVERDGLPARVLAPVQMCPGDTLWLGRTAIPWTVAKVPADG